jgi:hypothetical protein
MWALSLESLLVSSKQWSEISQGGDKPPGVSAFAYHSYSVSGKLKFAVCRGVSLYEDLKHVYL